MKRTPLTAEQVQEAAARYASGESFVALLRHYHVDHYTLKTAFVTAGVTLRKAGEALRTKLTEQDVDAMVSEYAVSPDMSRLADRYKTSHHKIREYLASRGVQILQRGQHPNRRLRPHRKDETGAITHIGCSACKQLKPASEFQRLRHGLAQTQNVCRECKIADRKRRLYGLSVEQYAATLAEQQFKCAICGCAGDVTRQHSPLMIDHNHTSGAVRGLLCLNCNAMIGHAREDERILDAGKAYLRKYRQ